MQCKDIDDKAVLRAVEAEFKPIGASRWDIHLFHFKDVPEAIMQAKMRALVRRGLLSGCPLGHNCRGDFTITPKGRELLGIQ